MDPERLSMVVHALVGVVVGYASFIMNDILGALGLAFLGAVFMRSLTAKIAKEKKDIKWWFANGAGTYFLLWFLSWIMFFNLA